MQFNLDGKIFTTLSNTSNGEVGQDTLFYYHQEGDMVWAEYSGGEVRKGHLIANVLENGQLDMRYHHINRAGEIMLGECISTPSITKDGRIKLSEEWQWLSGDKSSGTSQIIEIQG